MREQIEYKTLRTTNTDHNKETQINHKGHCSTNPNKALLKWKSLKTTIHLHALIPLKWVPFNDPWTMKNPPFLLGLPDPSCCSCDGSIEAYTVGWWQSALPLCRMLNMGEKCDTLKKCWGSFRDCCGKTHIIHISYIYIYIHYHYTYNI